LFTFVYLAGQRGLNINAQSYNESTFRVAGIVGTSAQLADSQPGKRRFLVTRSFARIAAVAAAAATIGSTALAATPSASASPAWTALNSSQPGVIEGIGGVNVRAAWGGTGATIIGHANNQDQVKVYCYVIATTVNGDPYWDELDDPNGYYLSNPSQPGVFGFVADALVYTKGDITGQVSKCQIPPG